MSVMTEITTSQLYFLARGSMNGQRGPRACKQAILAEIGDRGSIPFRRFMELALYDEREGYYMGSPERLGRGGDYYTASDAGR